MRDPGSRKKRDKLPSVEAAEEQLRAAKERLKAAKAHAKGEARKLDTHRKVLAGAFLIDKHLGNLKVLRAFRDYLEPKDRKAFADEFARLDQTPVAPAATQPMAARKTDE